MKKVKIIQVFLCIAAIAVTLLLTMHLNSRNVGNVKEEEVIVAVIDSGLDKNSIPEDRLADVTYDCFHQVEEVTDTYGHGTSVASLIVENTNDRVKIMPVCVTDEEGNSTIDLVCEGMEYAVNHGADIINLSMNTSFYSDNSRLENLINELSKKGIPVVVSAGNNGEDIKYLTPANIKSAIVVGAVDDKEEVYYFSNYGEIVDYYAYGKYDGQLGTSFAAAYVTAELADHMQNFGCGFEKTLKELPIQVKAENCIIKEKWNTGKKAKEEGTLYIGKTEKTSHDIGVGILDIDWKNLDTEELDAYIGETDYSYVGLFLNKLSKEEKQALMEKSKILSTDVYVGYMECSKEEEVYLETASEEISYVEYALDCYENEKDVMRVSDWKAHNDATFYISSPDRKKIAKYTVSGFNGKYAHASSVTEGMEIGSFTYASSVYKNEALSYDGTFTMPKVSSITTYIRNARATLVEYYDSAGNLVKETFKPGHVAAGNDNGDLLYGISIKFSGYSNTRKGYHNAEEAIVAYNAGAGVGTSTKTATYTDVGSGETGNQVSMLSFNRLKVADKMVVKYNVTLKAGTDINDFTKDDIEKGSYSSKTLKNIYYLSDETTLVDGSSTLYLSGNPYYSLGLKWYSDGEDNELVAKSDVPEYVMKLAPNTYTIKYNANGGSGTTASSKHTYNTAKALTANGFTRTGYTFTGWNTKADGSGTSYANKASVKNLTSTDGATVTLYAQWKAKTTKISYHANGGSIDSNTYTLSSSKVYKDGSLLTKSFSYTGTSINLADVSTFGLYKKGYHIVGTSAWRIGSTTGIAMSQRAVTDTVILKEFKNAAANGENVVVYANWQANTYMVKYNGNGSTSGSTASSKHTYNTAKALTANGFTRTGYTFTGWNTKADGSGKSYADMASVKNLTTENGATITLYAQWSPNTYTIHFDANGGEGYMDDIILTYDLPQSLPVNAFTRNNGYGESVFLGWGITPDTREVSYMDGAEILNATEIDGSMFTLYAIWDDCPWISAEDQYYSIEDAQNGLITYDELISHAIAFDREDGENIPSGVNEETGTAFWIADYQPTDFTIFTSEGSVTETFKVVDSVGNTYQKTIMVYIVDTKPQEIKPVGTTRFIDEKYYYETFENGGLEDNSIWKTDPEYVSVITEAFENSRNNTPIMSYHFEYKDILEMKQFVQENEKS